MGRWIFPLLALPLCLPSMRAQDSQKKRQGDNPKIQIQQEESADYFKKWLNEDVLYIIMEAEREVFDQLSTIEEKEQFIEQFWFRRDPNPITAPNEFKEEHYRRIAFSNERFSSGIPGWLSDRGRIYIIHGEPAEINSHPSGAYNRPFHEGGGTTATYPFETWRYRYIEGMGGDIELEFVDPTLSGEYRLALTPDEKDALLHVPGAGMTTAETLGLASKADRPYFSPGNRNYPLAGLRARDAPFERYERYVQIQIAPVERYKDFKELIEINISYDVLPLKAQPTYFRLNQKRSIVPLTVELENKDLMFTTDGDRLVAKVAIYGIITSLTNRVVTEFEDDLLATVSPEQLAAGKLGRSMYQKVVVLENRGRYKIDLVVKDLSSGNTGVHRQALVPPPIEEEKLTASSLLLSDFVGVLDEHKEDQLFVLGDVWIRPSLEKKFPSTKPMSLYVQLYNSGFDQTDFRPALDLTYAILDGNGKVAWQSSESSGESIQFVSGQRVVLLKKLDISQLSPDRYTVRLDVRDRITDQRLTVSGRFDVVSTPSTAG